MKRRVKALWSRLRSHVRTQALIRNLTSKPPPKPGAKDDPESPGDKPQPKWIFRQIYFQCTDSFGVRKLGDVFVL